MTRKLPWGVHTIGNIIAPKINSTRLQDGSYGRSVPCPYYGNRLVAAWYVLTGRAYALRWPTCEELNAALRRVDCQS